HNLVCVTISVTGVNEKTRMLLEPRTSTYKSRFSTIESLAKCGVPCGVQVAPIIPGINNFDIPAVLEQAGNAGASHAGMIIVRLNGAVVEIFRDWLSKYFRDWAVIVWARICDCNGGNVNDSRFVVRMRGEGKIAESITLLFNLSRARFIKEKNN